MSETDTVPRPEDGTPHRRSRLPWAVTAALAVLVVLLAIALPYVRGVSDRASKAAAAAGTGTVALSTDYQEAVDAAATEAANLLTYSRKTFDADWDRSLAGATGKLKSQHAAQKAGALKQITASKIDLKARTVQKAFESADEHGNVLVLITVNGFVVNDQGQTGAATPQRLELTMVRSGGKWLATNLDSIGIQ